MRRLSGAARFAPRKAFGRRLLAVVLRLLPVLAIVLGFPAPARATWDPALRFYTLETPHFRVHYHTGLEEVAQHVASTAESIHGTMTDVMGYTPTKDKTDIALTDNAESANGSASALPYNAIRLLVTAPEDNSPLGDVDDWFLELVVHEYTHVLHTDHIRGIPSLVNAVIGKTIAPNQIQPRWILEGYGVYHESARTSAGRLRNSMWDMFMRADVLEDNVASLDQISNIVRRWPQGNLFYLYGSYFVQWIQETYGEQTFRNVSRDYGTQLIPWGIQRSIRRQTGKTYDELYPVWIDSMRRRYRAQADAVRSAGIRGGVRLTRHGQAARYPHWIPDNAWPEHKGGILYWRDDQHGRPGLYALDVTRDAGGAPVPVAPAKTELIARTPVESYANFLPDGGVLFGSVDWYKNYFVYGDIEKLEPGKRSPFGTPDGGRTRLTETALRATDPAASPDGRRVVFVRNHAGTRSIHIGDLEPEGIMRSRPLVTTSFLEQAFTPRWSPDGTHVVYSVWKRGGYRDIRLVDVRDGSWRDLTSDRAVDGTPSFSPDGRFVFFHSDRTGIMNVHAYELASGRLFQVTNVIMGAYAPDVSPDGKTLAYIGYGKDGFDVYAMALDERAWPEAPPYVDTHPSPPTVVPQHYPSRPYSPWHTLLPRRYSVSITPGNFGQAAIITALGSDITGFHNIVASTTSEFEKPEIQGSLGYTYAGLPIDFSASVSRAIAPRAGYGLGAYKPTIIQEVTAATTALSYTQPRAYDSRTYAVSYSASRIGANFPMPIDKIDPYETPAYPARGLATTLHFGYSFSNAERYLWSIGPERGFALSLGFDVTDPILGGELGGFAANGDFTTYLLMPWLRHHSLALHAGAGTSGGQVPGRGAFYVGGFVDLPLIDTLRNQLAQGSLVLRGYAPVAVAGRSYTLGNAEYRFPIVNLDRGDSTLPFFVNRISGAAFVDYGTAFDVFQDARFKTGVGAELWFDLTLGYVASFSFRAGYARGLASLGIDKLYFVASFPF